MRHQLRLLMLHVVMLKVLLVGMAVVIVDASSELRRVPALFGAARVEPTVRVTAETAVAVVLLRLLRIRLGLLAKVTTGCSGAIG